MDPELSRKNVRFGLMLLALSLVLAGGTVGVAFLYLAFD
jgi:hypothetical protein